MTSRMSCLVHGEHFLVLDIGCRDAGKDKLDEYEKKADVVPRTAGEGASCQARPQETTRGEVLVYAMTR